MSSRVRTPVVGAGSGPDDGLSLPRPPGVFRRFWARHPRITDALVAVVALLTSLPVFVSSAAAVPVAQTVLAVSLVVLGSLALLLRRSQPLPVFAVAMLPTVVLSPSIAPSAQLLPAFALYAVAVYRSTRACWIALGVGLAAMAAGGVVAVLLAGAIWPDVTSSLISGVVTLLIAALIGINVGNRRRYLEAVIDRSRQLLVERDQQAQLAAAAERTRIAREMHDIVSHSLTVVVALSEGAAAAKTPEQAREASLGAAATARAALVEMRAMLGVLRDPPDASGGSDSPLAPLDPVDPGDVVAAAQRAGFPVVWQLNGRLDDVPRSVRFALGRVVQESVTNAIRHAPAATRVDVAVIVDDDAVRIAVENDGVGAMHAEATPAGPHGWGLQGLRERVEHVRGTLEAGHVPGSRWRVSATLPLACDHGDSPA